MTLDELPTPALVLDLDRLDANIAAMASRCRSLGVRLRPHLKTHKCVEIAERQRAAGARGVTVSTLFEAEVFAEHGFDDITWAFPVVLNRIAEAARLAHRVTLRLVVDSLAAVDALERAGQPFHVWLKVDCGYHRAGVDPTSPEALALARRIAASPSLRFDGLLTHSGHAYHAENREAMAAVAEAERRSVAELRERLAAEGIAGDASVGSTPGMSAVRTLEGVQEARPGNYVFYDAQQVALGACAPAACALSVVASVVSNAADHAVIDAGALALSKDVGPGAAYGRIYDDHATGSFRDDLQVVGLSQEHGKISAPLPIGERVRLLPAHACLAAACFDAYHVVQGERVVDTWRIWRGRS